MVCYGMVRVVWYFMVCNVLVRRSAVIPRCAAALRRPSPVRALRRRVAGPVAKVGLTEGDWRMGDPLVGVKGLTECKFPPLLLPLRERAGACASHVVKVDDGEEGEDCGKVG